MAEPRLSLWRAVGALVNCESMEPLPPDFARHLAEVLEPGDEAAAAEVIQTAIRLDDERLRVFFEVLSERVRSSAEPIKEAELRQILQAARRHGRTGAA